MSYVWYFYQFLEARLSKVLLIDDNYRRKLQPTTQQPQGALEAAQGFTFYCSF